MVWKRTPSGNPLLKDRNDLRGCRRSRIDVEANTLGIHRPERRHYRRSNLPKPPSIELHGARAFAGLDSADRATEDLFELGRILGIDSYCRDTIVGDGINAGSLDAGIGGLVRNG